MSTNVIQKSSTSDLNHPAHPTLEGLSYMGLGPMAPGPHGPGPPMGLGLWAHETQAHRAHGPIGPGP